MRARPHAIIRAYKYLGFRAREREREGENRSDAFDQVYRVLMMINKLLIYLAHN